MKGASRKFFFTTITGVLLLATGLAGCSSKPAGEHAQHAASNQQQLAGGDTLETTSGPKELPTFLKNLDPQIAQIYELAAYNHDTMDHIACYCGCGESVGHRSNRECFINEVKPDGKIVWNSHGTTCANCMNIAVESIQMKQQGKSILEIRKYIDNKYKEGYAKPTPTPMPGA
nr:PCYCGC motif-containing (lipo)protein [Aneurinibacillus tyrosinisolvens]